MKIPDEATKRRVMWGEYEVDNYQGIVDFHNWEFGEEVPWLACEEDGFRVVVPNWAMVDGEMDCLMAGISFIAMVKDYKETFLSCSEEGKDLERENAIACLKKAISILEDNDAAKAN